MSEFCKVTDMLAGLYFMLIIFANVAQSAFCRFYRATGNHLALLSALKLATGEYLLKLGDKLMIKRSALSSRWRTINLGRFNIVLSTNSSVQREASSNFVDPDF